ncbi:MAG: FKBP-type peptidyl-prolyl cis-trans isomerase [Haliscomenobacter sp.]|nr:FKBP-type peptidyl-prolyl cis-trans isomerase [Haliscomenobacter sp.]MBK7477425.1 FKBP-type peptidyl-prolyl cis-trans isomerase [Haliscomenobacter sp.]
MRHFIRFLFLLLPILALPSCKLEDQAEIDQEKIEQYLADNKLSATRHSSGIYYIISTPGSGGSPSLTSTVTVNYKGYYVNNSVFDQTTGSPIQFPLNNLIQGWQIAIPLLQKGGKGTFFIPSQLGYGSYPPQGIPANAVLIFDIELVDFK